MIGLIRPKRAIEPFQDDESDQEAESIEIKSLCAQASAFAGACSSPSAGRRCPMYVRIRDTALTKIDELEEGFYRDFSAFYAIEMCIAADEFTLAHELYRDLTSDYFRWKAGHEHPWLLIVH